MAEVGYIGNDNILYLYPDTPITNDLLNRKVGNTGITVAEAMKTDVLKTVNKPATYTWSFDNMLKNVDTMTTGISSGLKTAMLIGGGVLLLAVILK
jgi:hypothetical protein